MSLKPILLAAIAIVVSTSVKAIPITHGALSTNNDGSTNIITDTLNNVEWLRFDVLKDLTYAETVAVADTQDGGGWHFASTADALNFTSAFLAPAATLCTGTQTRIVQGCGASESWADGDFGDNFDGDLDAMFYLNTESSVGLLRFSDADNFVSLTNVWKSIPVSDAFSTAGGQEQHISWLLYRSTTVPEPSIALLMASGLIAFSVVRRKSRI